MVTLVVSIALYAVIAVRFMQIGIFSIFELVLAVAPLYPLKAYSKKGMQLGTVYFTLLSLATLGRLYMFNLLMGNLNGAPVTYDLQLQIAKASGAVYFAVMVIYLIIVWFVTAMNIRSEFRYNKKRSEFNEGSARFIRRMHTLMSASVVAYIFNVVLGTFVFSMSDYALNAVVFILIAVAIDVAHTLYIRGSYKEWNKEHLKPEEEDKEYGM